MRKVGLCTSEGVLGQRCDDRTRGTPVDGVVIAGMRCHGPTFMYFVLDVNTTCYGTTTWRSLFLTLFVLNREASPGIQRAVSVDRAACRWHRGAPSQCWRVRQHNLETFLIVLRAAWAERYRGEELESLDTGALPRGRRHAVLVRSNYQR